MSAGEKLPQLAMLRPHVGALPPLDLPPGYLVRAFRPGDEGGWEQLVEAAFDFSPGFFDFDKMMRQDPAFAPERIYFACASDGQLAATASAWHAAAYGPGRGILHWVATHPRHRGRRLGYWVSVAAMHRAAAEGRCHLHLLTDDHRLPAVLTYLRLDFRPALTHSSHPERWRRVLEQLGLLRQYEQMLQGPLVRLEP